MATSSKVSIHPAYERQVRMWPHLTRFYGLSPADLAGMEYWLLEVYLEAMPEIEAEEQLARIQASDFPHADPQQRKSVHRALVRTVERVAEPTGQKTAPAISDPAAEAGKLAKIGIRVKLESLSKKTEPEAVGA